MTDLDQMARDLLGGEYQKAPAANPKCNFCTETWDVAIAATRAALLTAPPGWKLVPVEPTDEMAAIERLTAERDALQAQLDWTVRETDRLLDEGRDLAAMRAAAPEVK